MIKLFGITVFSIILSVVIPPSEHSISENRIVSTCYGKTPCNACSNCSMCKYCTKGGTCGKCAKKEKSSGTMPRQCKAVTKKGSRCKRSADDNGYCWQHGR